MTFFSLINKRKLFDRACFLSFWKRWYILNPWNKGLVIDGKNKISEKRSRQHLALVAPTGLGKSTRFILPNALSLSGDCSAVFTDPAGEIYDISHNYLRSKDYLVLCLDLRQDCKKLQYNPLHRVHSISDAQKLAHILLLAAYPNSSSDTFWVDSAKALLGLLINYLAKSKDGPPTLLKVYQLLHQMSYNSKSIERAITTTLSAEQFEQYKAFLAQDKKIITGVLSTAKTALHQLSDPHLQWLTSKESLHFETLREQPTALFIIVPEQEIGYYSFLLSILYSQLFHFCLQNPSKESNYLPIRFFLDEFGNMNIPNFPTYITVLRKKRCSVSIVLQELQQLKTQYKDQAQTILNGGCANHIYYPALGLETCQELEKTLGYRTVYKELNGKIISQKQPLMSSDCIRTMPLNRALFITTNERPILLKTKAWFKRFFLRKQAKKKN